MHEPSGSVDQGSGSVDQGLMRKLHTKANARGKLFAAGGPAGRYPDPQMIISSANLRSSSSADQQRFLGSISAFDSQMAVASWTPGPLASLAGLSFRVCCALLH